MRTWKKVLGGMAAAGAGSVALCAGVFGPCWSSWLLDGILVDTCPEGDVRPVAYAQVSSLGRGDVGYIVVEVLGHYWNPDWRTATNAAVGRFSVDLALVSPTGEETPVEPEDGWDESGDRQYATLKLPEVPDGDWLLRVRTDGPAGEASVDVKLPLYVPALGHALTDAPLYKPGQDVRFRAVLLAEDTLVPLEGRPGTWRVTDPEGTLLLEEPGKTGPFGVVASSFPLDPEAASGTWTATFTSGATVAAAPFQVRPFRLPKMTVEATAAQPAFFPGERPVVEGVVRYASGAPVAGARVHVVPGSSGAWPPPLAWMAEQDLVADGEGRFRLAPGVVPGDLVGQATMVWRVEAGDGAGEVTRGEARALLSEDRLAVDAVTELGGGLVPSANNRVWVRATSAEGTPLADATVKMRPQGDVEAEWRVATADVDGVARFQIDPGEPVTVVVPAQPVRPRPRRAVDPVRVDDAQDRLGGSIDLADRVVLDRWRAALAPCADAVGRGSSVMVDAAAVLTPAGRVALASASARSTGDAPSEAAAACVERRLGGLSGPSGSDRVWSLTLTFADPETPLVEAEIEVASGADPGVALPLAAGLLDARACVRGESASAELPRALLWRARGGSARLETNWVTRPGYAGLVSASAVACVERALGGLVLPEAADDDGLGLVTLSAAPAPSDDAAAPEAQTWPGFAWEVVAEKGGAEVGRTVLRQPVGQVPPLRLRASEVVVDPGADVEITALRGPDFRGSLPKELRLVQGTRELTKFDFDPDKKVGTVKVPADAAGFATIEWDSARAVLYVRPKAILAVEVTPEKASYRPGEEGVLLVRTSDANGGVAAGVTLSGVDATMGQLAALPTPETWAATVVRATSDQPAFGVLDARALTAGRVRGDNAQQATVLRVSNLPSTPPGADLVTADATGTFDPDGELADAFYAVYRRARKEVRAWEASAKEGEVLTAAKMASLWQKAAASPAEGDPADPYGRTLRLGALPPDLLALTDPRLMVSDGARLPEDVENWSAWVAVEAP